MALARAGVGPGSSSGAMVVVGRGCRVSALMVVEEEEVEQEDEEQVVLCGGHGGGGGLLLMLFCFSLVGCRVV